MMGEEVAKGFKSKFREDLDKAAREAERTILLDFVEHLKSRSLLVCSFSTATGGYWPINTTMEEYVENYLENK